MTSNESFPSPWDPVYLYTKLVRWEGALQGIPMVLKFRNRLSRCTRRKSCLLGYGYNTTGTNQPSFIHLRISSGYKFIFTSHSALKYSQKYFSKVCHLEKNFMSRYAMFKWSLHEANAPCQSLTDVLLFHDLSHCIFSTIHQYKHVLRHNLKQKHVKVRSLSETN